MPSMFEHTRNFKRFEAIHFRNNEINILCNSSNFANYMYVNLQYNLYDCETTFHVHFTKFKFLRRTAIILKYIYKYTRP